MTFREKYMLDHPNTSISSCESLCPNNLGYCDLSYLVDSERRCKNTCTECWDLEMPEPEKETETNNMNLSKMKKDELVKQIEELNVELKKLEKYKKYEDNADELKAMMDIYAERGFSREDVFRLMEIAIKDMR